MFRAKGVSLVTSALLLTAVFFITASILYVWGYNTIKTGFGVSEHKIGSNELRRFKAAMEEVSHEGKFSSRKIFLTHPLSLKTSEVKIWMENGSETSEVGVKSYRFECGGSFLEFEPEVRAEGSELVVMCYEIAYYGGAGEVLVKNTGCSSEIFESVNVSIGEPYNASYENVTLRIYKIKLEVV